MFSRGKNTCRNRIWRLKIVKLTIFEVFDTWSCTWSNFSPSQELCTLRFSRLRHSIRNAKVPTGDGFGPFLVTLRYIWPGKTIFFCFWPFFVILGFLNRKYLLRSASENFFSGDQSCLELCEESIGVLGFEIWAREKTPILVDHSKQKFAYFIKGMDITSR